MSSPSIQAQLGRRARLQLLFAVIAGALTLLALIIPAWIESATSLEPDGGNGVLEWLLAVAFGAVSIVFGVLTYRTRRQLAAAQATAG